MCGVLTQQCAKPLGCDEHGPLLVTDEADDHERAERRVQTEPAEGDFFPVEALVVLRGGQLQNGVVRHGCLDQRPPGQCGAPAAAHDLGDKAEHALVCAEALPEQQRVNA